MGTGARGGTSGIDVTAHAAAPTPFDVLGPLPTGTTLLEASAGTGKTWTIAALLTRFVAEGAADLPEVLLITFGRAATRELRERVRERLVEARDVLSLGPGAHPDPLLGYLAAGSPDEVAERQHRLARACVDFDAATIATTHGFCQLVIRSLGTAADADPATELLEDLGELVEEAALDLYLRRWAPGGDPLFGAKDALAIARAATLDSHARLLPDHDETDEAAATRARFAAAVRAEVARRLRERRAMSFDDLLAHLARVLAHDEDGPAVAARLRGRYRFVLVDEFQDTDPVQWQILHRAFHGHATLVLIGDPKQAIYAFRGGDVHSYLAAAAVADTRATLDYNWRSDAALLRGLEALFDGAALGEEQIVVSPVAAGRPAPLLRTAHPRAPVQVRIVPTTGLPTTGNGEPLVDGVRPLVVRDLVTAIVEALDDGSTIADEVAGPWRAVRPGDIAVLVRSNGQAEQVRDALVGAGVPSVLRATSNVFATAAARDWLVLLEAVEQPHRVGRVRRLAVSAFLGRDAAALDAGGDAAHDALAHELRGWSAVLTESGVAALFAAADAAHGAVARLLGQVGGERQATDLRHVAEILHAAAMREGLGPAALLTWLRRRIEEAATPQGNPERSRRLDSDAAAVQVVTVHASKGLEFPLVYVPFGWDRSVREPDVALFHDADGRRCRDVGGPTGTHWADAVRAHLREDAGEDLRLLYVAATRARSALTVWWARSTITAESAVNRLLCRPPGPGNPPARVPIPDEARARALISERAAASAGTLEVVTAVLGPPPTWTPAAAPVGVPTAAVFDRTVDTAWRRTSYSALTALAHEAGPAPVDPLAETESPGTVDEPDADPQDAAAAQPADVAAAAPAFALLPAGAAFGTVVHTVLETVDLTAPDIASALITAATAALTRTPLPDLTGVELGQTLLPALQTPLGAIAGGRSLRAFGADRLCELEFELPLAGGDSPGRLIRLAQLRPVLETHLAADDPVRAWLPRLSSPDLAEQPLRGYLTGSIDTVLRVPDPAGPGYVVVDYKTNRLHPADAEPSLWHYRDQAMQAAMFAADYPLQALLYQVALHRYLTWRQPGYDPERHLRGALYLFLRGMPGAAPTGEASGVYAWRPRPAAVVATSEFLAGVR
jgi:exodeoxyribonuclease V beta subunit